MIQWRFVCAKTVGAVGIQGVLEYASVFFMESNKKREGYRQSKREKQIPLNSGAMFHTLILPAFMN